MARVINHHRVDDTTRTALETPRDDWMLREQLNVDGSFGCETGPFASWTRTVAQQNQELLETIEYRVAAPLWGRAIDRVLAFYLRRPARDTAPFWAPPDRFDARSARILALLTMATLAAAYLGTLLSQTISFVADEFLAGQADDARRSLQGSVLSLTRIGALLALVIVWLADRLGRRRLLLASGVGSCLFAALTAIAPSIWWYAASQTLSRGLATGFGLLIAIVAAEESPAGARAWVTSVLALTAGLGAGMVLWLVPLADAGIRTWRWLFVIALLGLPVLWGLKSRLTETRRYTAHAADKTAATPITSDMRIRFMKLATVGLAASMFAAPSSNFQVEYLREDRGFSGTRISLFSTIVSTPVGIGVAIAGPIADRRGRRLIGAIGLIGGVIFTVARYNLAGPLMWISGLAATIIGAATIPALGVYGAELFPTSRRGLANGMLTLIGTVGSVIGLQFVGHFSESSRWGFGRSFLVLAIVPLLASAVIALYPKTARRSLEEINPSDPAIDTPEATAS